MTKVFRDAAPPVKHQFVADPSEGSRYNRGCAVDLTMNDLKTGREVSMPSGYDEMTERAYPDYKPDGRGTGAQGGSARRDGWSGSHGV